MSTQSSKDGSDSQLGLPATASAQAAQAAVEAESQERLDNPIQLQEHRQEEELNWVNTATAVSASFPTTNTAGLAPFSSSAQLNNNPTAVAFSSEDEYNENLWFTYEELFGPETEGQTTNTDTEAEDQGDPTTNTAGLASSSLAAQENPPVASSSAAVAFSSEDEYNENLWFTYEELFGPETEGQTTNTDTEAEDQGDPTTNTAGLAPSSSSALTANTAGLAPSSDLSVQDFEIRNPTVSSSTNTAGLASFTCPSLSAAPEHTAFGSQSRPSSPAVPSAKRRRADEGWFGTGGQGLRVLTVSPGEDIVQKVFLFMNKTKSNLCVLSALGTISSLSTRQPANSWGPITYQGHFDIISMSGFYLHNEQGARESGLRVCLADEHGRIIAGPVWGALIAADLVQIVVTYWSGT